MSNANATILKVMILIHDTLVFMISSSTMLHVKIMLNELLYVDSNGDILGQVSYQG